MSRRACEKIKVGLESAKAYLDQTADKRKYCVHVPEKVDVRKIRTRLCLSQEAFAKTYGFALSAVRDWEQGRRQPERSARILLKIVEREPEAVTRALASGRGRRVREVEVPKPPVN
jgi:putative transcriptional regulator